MALNHTLVTATLKAASGIPKDDFVNTFVFEHETTGFDLGTSTNQIALVDAVDSFYRGGTTTADAYYTYIGAQVNRSAGITYRLYNLTGKLDGSPHGSPFGVYPVPTLPGTTPTGNHLPEPVAAVLTLRGTGWDLVPIETPDSGDEGTAVDRLRARRTGRLYLGPLGGNAVAFTGGRTYLSDTARTAMLASASRMAGQIAALAGEMSWCVWSRKAAAVYPIDEISMDNRFDTQRRRSAAPINRTSSDLLFA